MNDPRVQSFRKVLNEWKKETFFEKLVQETDKDSIDRRIDEAHSMFQTLMDKLHEMEEHIQAKKQVGGDKAVNQILSTLGPEETWTEGLLDNARSILITDLYEYPLTFNAVLIDQFKEQPDFPAFPTSQ